MPEQLYLLWWLALSVHHTNFSQDRTYQLLLAVKKCSLPFLPCHSCPGPITLHVTQFWYTTIVLKPVLGIKVPPFHHGIFPTKEEIGIKNLIRKNSKWTWRSRTHLLALKHIIYIMSNVNIYLSFKKSILAKHSLLLARTEWMKSHGLLTDYSHPTSFPFIKFFPMSGNEMAILCLILNKFIFAGGWGKKKRILILYTAILR